MAQDFQTHKEKLYQQLKEQYGKVVYTYTAHLKNAGFLQRDCNRFKWVQIILSAISTGDLWQLLLWMRQKSHGSVELYLRRCLL